MKRIVFSINSASFSLLVALLSIVLLNFGCKSVASNSVQNSILNAVIKSDNKLVQAAANGNLPDVQNALTDGADINATGIVNLHLDNGKVITSGSTALTMAARNGHTEVVTLLLNKGADVNVKNTDGSTALIRASLYGHTEIVKLLLDKGADVNVKTTATGETALWMASAKGHTEIVKRLLEMGADVNVKGANNSSTPLMIASRNRHTDIVKLLLDIVELHDERAQELERYMGYDYALSSPERHRAMELLVFASGKMDREYGKKALSNALQLLSNERTCDSLQFTSYENKAIGIIAQSGVKSQSFGGNIKGSAGKKIFSNGEFDFSIIFSSLSPDYELIDFIEYRSSGIKRLGVLRVGDKYYIRDQDNFAKQAI